ncbi:putative F-box protein [Raphanus sativus]|nr:putative F-box protein [Raphanus sativus]
MQSVDKTINMLISHDPYLNSSIKGSIPNRCDGSRDDDGYEFTQPSSSAMEVDEKVGHDDKCIFNLSMIMSVIGQISPYAQKLVNKTETLLGKRLLIEDETELEMDVPSSSSDKFMNVERINKRSRFA